MPAGQSVPQQKHLNILFQQVAQDAFDIKYFYSGCKYCMFIIVYLKSGFILCAMKSPTCFAPVSERCVPSLVL